jgi:HCOMODA/2-hydroxy-3-carboxy-muconic semialdehyde decarboxylase
MTVVGSTIPQAVFRSIYTDVNARIQAQAMAFGKVTLLTEGEARAADLANQGQVDRAWNFWTSQISI